MPLKTHVQMELGRPPKEPLLRPNAMPVLLDCNFILIFSSCAGGIKNYCEPGYYCVAGAVPVACAAGTY